MSNFTNQSLDMGRRHVVVGDGITAAAFVEHCDLAAGDHLTVLGQNASQLGRGAAYAAQDPADPWCYAYLLNSPADDIDPAFARWLERNWAGLRDTMRGRQPDWLAAAQPLLDRGDTYGLNAPRAFYGNFMQEQMASVFAALRKRGVTITLHDAKAVSLSQLATHMQLTTDSGDLLDADSIDIAPGGPATQRFPGDDGPFSAPTLFGQEARIAEHIKAEAEIFCIGANATMLDVLRLCQSLIPDDDLNIVACSPSGGLPPPLVPRLPRYLTKPALTGNHATAQSFLDEVWTAMEKARAQGDEMREIRAGFRAYFIEHGLKYFVPNADEARLVPRTLRHWLRGGTRDTILDFHRLMKLGKCRTLGGGVVEIEHTDHGARVITRDKAGNITAHDTGFVINCAGAGPGSAFDPLTTQLIADGAVKTCVVTGGLEVGARCMTGVPNVRHLSPATTVIGDEVMPMPLYDAHLLRTWAARAYQQP
ncbi:MAG: FAD/NAD(P)-binding protein [Pseudomonadota bacterium]